MESVPYADEWALLRAQRQREYEQYVTLTRWGDLMDITNEIAQGCGPTTTTTTTTTNNMQQHFVQEQNNFVQKSNPFSQGYSGEFTSFTPRYSSHSYNVFGKGRM